MADTAISFDARTADSTLVGGWNAPSLARTRERAAYQTDRMHPGVFALAFGSYVALLLGLWVMFLSGTEMFISLGICTAYIAMFFGVPLVLYRVTPRAGGRAGSLGRFLRGNLDTVTGPLSGWSALAQVIVVPVSLGFGLLAMGIIKHLV